MFCRNCGKELPEKAMFCGKCGTKVEVVAETVVSDYTAPVEEVVVEEQVVVEEPVVEPIVETVVEEPVAEEPIQTQQTTANATNTQSTVHEQATSAQATTPQPHRGPALKLPIERKMWKMVVFGILTLGIYPMVVWSKIIDELNIAASRYDGIRTTNYFVATLLTSITFGIYGIWYSHTLCKRIGAELTRRGYDYKFGAGTYWGWGVFGSLIIVGPFIFLHKLTKAMNYINTSYNYYG